MNTMKYLFILLGVLLTTTYVACSKKAQDAAAKSVENMEANVDDTIANTAAVADVAKENMEAIAEEFVANTKALDVAAEDGKEAIDLSAKHTEEVVKRPTPHAGDVVRHAEEKTKDVDVAIKHTEEVVEKPTQHTGNVVRDAEEKTRDVDVTVGNTQESIEGIWDSGTENTKIEISQNNGEWVGKIISSDNEKATIGKVILKDLKKQNEIWKGELFVVKRQKWTDVEIVPNGTKLDLIVSAGPSSRKVQWSKANN